MVKRKVPAPAEDQEYAVESILNRRYRGNKVQYFIKWLGYPHSDNTWEDSDNVHCDELIQEFEKSLEQNRSKRQRSTQVRGKRGKDTGKKAGKKGEGRDKTYQPSIANGDKVSSIIGATKRDGKLYLMCKWVGHENEEGTLHSADAINTAAPDKVIKFYESRLRFEAN